MKCDTAGSATRSSLYSARPVPSIDRANFPGSVWKKTFVKRHAQAFVPKQLVSTVRHDDGIDRTKF